MKKSTVALLLLSASMGAQAGEKSWHSIKVSDSNPSGVATYIGTIDTDDLKSIATGTSAPEFLKINSLIVIDQSGAIRRASDIPWGSKFVVGNEIYVRASNIIDIQSINTNISKEFSALTK